MDESNILSVTEAALTYKDEAGQEKVIQFSECYRNYLDDWNDPERLAQHKVINRSTDDEIKNWLDRVKAIKQIGIRNPLEPPWADGPYIEFYTLPYVRFRFSDKNEYGRILDFIREGGWRTLDQS